MRTFKEILRAFLHHLARIFGLHRRRKPSDSNHDNGSHDNNNNNSYHDNVDPERQQRPDDVELDMSIDEDDDDDYDVTDDSGPPTCGCGRELKQGWACPDCRTNCPQCGRALGIDEPCDRCASQQQQQQQPQQPHR